MPIELLFAAGVPSPFHLSLPCALSVNCCLHKTSLSGGGPPGELLVGSGSLAFLKLPTFLLKSLFFFLAPICSFEVD